MTNRAPSSDESGVTARLKALLNEISSSLDNAPEDQKKRLLSFLEQWQQRDRRQYPRKPCAISVTYTVEDRTFTDMIKNVCPGGVFIETSHVFSVGQEVTVAFSPSSQGEPIECKGKIVWGGPKGIGVKFTTASKALEETIKSL